jgi:serine/threonine protein kinase/Tol biopolymer transport system component
MGSIYRAIDENLGVEVAVKENLFTTDEYARQFHREAVILASLRHPNLPRVTDHFVIDGQGQYLIMDYIEGEDLRERMDRLGVLPDDEVVVLGAAICDALSYLHSRKPQVVHRDIKPGNVKITPSGQIILVDFGLAKVVQGSQATTTGARAMTPGYSPPEQYGTARTDQRTDIYSLGASLYVALTGVLPEDALARAMEQVDLTPIRKHNPKAARRLAAVVEKALSLRPDDRYQSADEMKRALLSSRSSTVRRQPLEMTVPPPPNLPASPQGGNGDYGEAALEILEEAGPSPARVKSPSFGPTPLPASISLADVSAQPRPARRIGCWIGMVLVGLLLLGLAGTYTYQPGLFNQALAYVAPGVANSPTATQAEITPQVTEALPASATSTPEPTATTAPPTPQYTSTFSPVPPSPTRTHTPVPPVILPTPTFTASPFGGGSGQIAFASDVATGKPQIWIVNADGTSPRQVTDMPEGACQPSWSPDGDRLVFISPCAFSQEVYPGASLFIINADGTGLIPLPTVPGGDYDPAWSPNGSVIAFTTLRESNRPQIYQIRVEDMAVSTVSNNIWRDYQPAWSPDGEMLVFVSTRRGPSQLWIMTKDGGNQQLYSRSGSQKNSQPAWSPSGQVIAYTQNEPLGGLPRLMAASFLGFNAPEKSFMEDRIIKEIIPMREPAFSPDGIWLAFESWPEGADHNIYIMTVNGLGRQQVTNRPAIDFDPDWRPATRPP